MVFWFAISKNVLEYLYFYDHKVECSVKARISVFHCYILNYLITQKEPKIYLMNSSLLKSWFFFQCLLLGEIFLMLSQI